MALQTSGAISLLDIAGEFGGSAPHSLSEYYGVATGVPSSGAIKLSDFYGASSIITWVQAMSFSNYPYDPGSGKLPIPSGGFTAAGGMGIYPSPISAGVHVSIGHDKQAIVGPHQLSLKFYSQTGNGIPPPPDTLIRMYIPDIGWKTAVSADMSTNTSTDPAATSWRQYVWTHDSNSSAEAGGNKTITMEFNP